MVRIGFVNSAMKSCPTVNRSCMIKTMVATLTISVFLVISRKFVADFHPPVKFPTKINITPFLVKPSLEENQLRMLPDLSKLQWPPDPVAPKPAGRRNTNGTVEPLPDAFLPVMSAGQRALSKHLLQLFSGIMFSYGYGDRFMLYGGTLIGSYRHHDLIPWDDDLDVMVDEAIRPRMIQLLKVLEPEYLFVNQSGRGKFYTRLINVTQESQDLSMSRKSSSYSWGWPYLDISYYRKNNTHVCEIAESYGRAYCWPKTVLFPLRFRPLGHKWYPTPYDIVRFLELTYSELNTCVIFGYSHVLEGSGPQGRTPCSNLTSKYAFVRRSISPRQLDSDDNQHNKFVVAAEYLFTRSVMSGQQIIHILHLPALGNEINSDLFHLQ